MTECTPKQHDFLKMLKEDGLKRINLLEGSVSSGKTWISLIAWALWVRDMPKDRLYLMCAKSLTTLKRNCLILLQELVGQRDFIFSIPSKEGYLFGRHILFEGANDARAESKIRGITLQGAYCDELTQFPEDFFAMLLSRLRVPGAKLIATTNPDTPYHWLKVNYIDRQEEIDFLDVKFTIDDNTTLPDDYVENIKKEYVGVFYDRFILGLWKVAEGLVYDLFDESEHVINELPWQAKQYGSWYVSIDYGTVNAFSAGIWCVHKGIAYRVKEYYYDSRAEHRRVDDETYYAALERFIGDIKVCRIIIDPSAASFKETIRKHGKFSYMDADNSVIDGIRVTASLLNAGKIKIMSCCKDLIKEIKSYSWDMDAPEDTVIKENDHACDDMRYFCMSVLRRE